MYLLIAVAVTFPPAPVVFGVGQDMQNKELLIVISDVGDQSAPVFTDVEHDASSYLINAIPSLFYVGEATPSGSLGYPVPGPERRVPFRMIRGSLSNLLPAYDPHRQSSHIAKSASTTIDGGRLDTISPSGRSVHPMGAGWRTGARKLPTGGRSCAHKIYLYSEFTGAMRPRRPAWKLYEAPDSGARIFPHFFPNICTPPIPSTPNLRPQPEPRWERG